MRLSSVAYLVSCSVSSVSLWKFLDWFSGDPESTEHRYQVPVSGSEFRCECSCPSPVVTEVPRAACSCWSVWPWFLGGLFIGLFLWKWVSLIHYTIIAVRYTLSAIPGQPTQVSIANEAAQVPVPVPLAAIRSGPVTPGSRRNAA